MPPGHPDGTASNPGWLNCRAQIWFRRRFRSRSVPRFLLMPESQHVDGIPAGSWRYKATKPESPNSMIGSRHSGCSEKGRPTAGVVSSSRNCRTMAWAARRAASGLLLARKRRQRSNPWPAPSVMITCGTQAVPSRCPCPRCSTTRAPLARSNAGLFPDRQSRTPVPPP